MELFATVMDLAGKWAPVMLAVLGAAVLVLAAISPITKSQSDDKALAALRKFEAWLIRVVVPMLSTRAKVGESGAKAEAAKAEKAAAADKKN